MKKIKALIHKYRILEKTVFYLWGLFCLARAKIVFKKIGKSFAKTGKPKILILSLRMIPTTNLLYFDSLFAHAFSKLGCEVKMLYCGGVLDSCDADTVLRDQKTPCFLCQKFKKTIKNSFGLDWVSYSQFISEPEIKEIKEIAENISTEKILDYQYLGVKVGKHARESTIRYFLLGKLDLNNKEELSMLRKKLFYAMINAKVADKIQEKIKPDVVLTMHGFYSTWGPFLSYFSQKGVNVFTQENMLPRLGYFSFARNNRSNKPFSEKEWEDFIKNPLKKEEEKTIDEYLQKRFKGISGDQEMFTKNFSSQAEKKSILDYLFSNDYQKRYAMFPNLAWDAGIEGHISEIFEDAFAWIDAVVKFFKTKKNYQLIIKPHPGELIWEGCSRSVKEYILAKHGPLPENIVLLNANVPLRAYDLIRKDTIALTYNGTIGMELAAMGAPVLLSAYTRYREAGAVLEVKTLEEYMNLLENPEKLFLFAKNHIELAKKYAYFYFFKLFVRVPFYKDSEWSALDWNFINNQEKMFGKDSNVMKICQKIMNKEDVLEPL